MLSFPAPSMEDGGGFPRGPVLALVFFPPPARAAAGPPELRLGLARLFPVTVAAGGAGGTWPLAFGPVCRGAAKMGRRRLGFPPAAAVELTGGGTPPPAPEEPVEKGGAGGGCRSRRPWQGNRRRREREEGAVARAGIFQLRFRSDRKSVV